MGSDFHLSCAVLYWPPTIYSALLGSCILPSYCQHADLHIFKKFGLTSLSGSQSISNKTQYFSEINYALSEGNLIPIHAFFLKPRGRIKSMPVKKPKVLYVILFSLYSLAETTPFLMLYFHHENIIAKSDIFDLTTIKKKVFHIV